MAGKRFIMNAGRTTKQGRQINIGKNTPEYDALVSTLIMHPEDLAEIGAAPGDSLLVRSENGEVTLLCAEHGGKNGKVPRGMVFIPFGPPTCRLMGQRTDGTGMPLSKGWEVEIEPIAAAAPADADSRDEE